MARYIDADALKGKTLGIEWCDETKTLSFHEHIDDVAPTAKVAPIADTVKKMQELIKERCNEGGIYPAFVASTIDQVAKEILEGKDGH